MLRLRWLCQLRSARTELILHRTGSIAARHHGIKINDNQQETRISAADPYATFKFPESDLHGGLIPATFQLAADQI